MKIKNIFGAALLLSAYCISTIALCSNDVISYSACADATFATEHMEMQKNEFQVGEPIYIKTKNTSTSDVVYLVQKGWEGDTSTGEAGQNVYIRYRFARTSDTVSETGMSSRGVEMGVDDLYYWDMRTASTISTNKNSSLSNIPAGDYEMLYVKADGWEDSYSEKLSFTVKESGVSNVNAYHITTNKTTYDYGEKVTINLNGEFGDTDWVGYCGITEYATGNNYIYCKGNTTFEFTPTTIGSYRVGFVYNNDYFFRCSETIVIRVDSLNPCSTEHLAVEKTDFATGEAIRVTPTVQNPGQGDWIGIGGSDYETNGSIIWKYIESGVDTGLADGFGSGITVDLNTEAYISRSDLYPLQPGTYWILFVPKNGGAGQATEKIEITIQQSTPMAPSSMIFNLDNATDGIADGDITITIDGYDSLSAIVRPSFFNIYWGDGNGNKLEGYSSWSTKKVIGKTTTFDTVENVMIPNNAKEVLVYGSNGTIESENCLKYQLPADCQMKLPEENIYEFQVASDLHINNSTSNEMTVHYRQFLESVKSKSPNSSGIFVNGDAVNTASTTQYSTLNKYYREVGDLPYMYLGMGNHEYLNGLPDGDSGLLYTYNTEKSFNLWKSSTYLLNNLGIDQLEHNYYDLWLNGCHYIFLGNEEIVSDNAFISNTQLAWLREKLNEDRQGNPIYLFCHQGLYNTVAGTLDGQGWHGIVAGGQARSYARPVSGQQLVTAEKPLRDILKDYPEIVMFSGHSHWDMNSASAMKEADSLLPTIFDTSAVGYIWDDRNIYIEGSQAYFLEVYHDMTIVRGYNVDKGNWIASAQFVVKNKTHNIVNSNAVSATCIVEGHTSGSYCDICGEVFTPETIIPQLEHNYSYTELNENYHIRKCSVGGEEDQLPHNYNSNDVCVDCGHIKEKQNQEDPEKNNKSKSKIEIILGCSIPLVVIGVAAGVTIIIIKKKKNKE